MLTYFFRGLVVLGMASPLFSQTYSGKVILPSGEPAFKAAVTPMPLGTLPGQWTDSLGRFSFEFPEGGPDSLGLQISLLGWTPLEATLFPNVPATFTFKSHQLQVVQVSDQAKGTIIGVHTIPMETLTRTELTRAACCNLAESFETNPTVDVSLSDAVTGAKTLRMLGMEGKYVQITSEMLPGIRGIASGYGLAYVPGPWMENVQISKGTGSVVNGFESLTGQINLEYLKPESADPWHVNIYVNHMGRAEINLQHAAIVNPRWSVLTLLHANRTDNYQDHNNDGFLDMPVVYTLSGLHRWKYQGKRREAQIGIRALREMREGGTRSFFVPDTSLPVWHYQLQTTRIEGFGKHGFLFPDKPYMSVGLMASVTYHEQKGNFGPRLYQGSQWTGYFNGIHQTIIGDTRHGLKWGMSYQWDRVEDRLDSLVFERNEHIPGAFAEYTYNGLNGLSLVAGFRTDYHNLFGLQATPRLHVKWDLSKQWVWRISGGSGFRTPNVLGDNLSMLVTGRNITWESALGLEKAWTAGTGLIWTAPFTKRPLTAALDVWYTHFTDRLIIDRETSGGLRFYMSDQPARSMVSQLDLTWNPMKWLEVRGSYKFQHVTAFFGGVEKQETFVPRHRLLFTSMITWAKPRLQFDITAQITGSSRLPEMQDVATGLFRPEASPWFTMVHAQVKWQQNKRFEWYLGGENLLNFTQADPILNPYIPGQAGFDGSMAWGPVFGTMVYAGVRWTIPKPCEGKP